MRRTSSTSAFTEFVADAVVVLLAREAGGVEEERGDLVELRAVEDGRGGFVGDDDAEIDDQVCLRRWRRARL